MVILLTHPVAEPTSGVVMVLMRTIVPLLWAQWAERVGRCDCESKSIPTEGRFISMPIPRMEPSATPTNGGPTMDYIGPMPPFVMVGVNGRAMMMAMAFERACPERSRMGSRQHHRRAVDGGV